MSLRSTSTNHVRIMVIGESKVGKSGNIFVSCSVYNLKIKMLKSLCTD